VRVAPSAEVRYRTGIVTVTVILGFAIATQVRTVLAIRSSLHIVPEQVEALGFQLQRRRRLR
jgi:hypothetical protein